MSLFSNNYLMNIEKEKIKVKNKKNKYISSKPNYLMISNTNKYLEEKKLNNKSFNYSLTSNNNNNHFNNYLLTNNNTKKYFNNYNNDENKENMKNIFNTNNFLINTNNYKTERNILVNKYYNLNLNTKKININNNNYKKIEIKPKKKGRTLSSNITKIIKENTENKNELKTYRNNTRKKNDFNELVSNHKKSKSIILSESNLNIFPSKSFCINKFCKQKNFQKINKSLSNNITEQFYINMKHIIPKGENNNKKENIIEYKNKGFIGLNKYKNIKINKSFTSSNIRKFNINEHRFNNDNNSLLNINKYLNKNKEFKSKNKNKIFEKKKKKILKIDSCTIPGYSLTGVKQKNLDSFFLKKNFLDKEENFLIGICDGHGIYGDLISQYISQNLSLFIKNISKENLIKSFIDINNSLIYNTNIDCSLSGTTCTSLIISLDKIICINIGNTRAILARYENGCYNSTNLNRDHKLTELDEIKRIIKKGGIIKQSYDKIKKEYIGPEKIWLKNSDIPGLNISRSFGDNIAHTIGVINIPDINIYEYNGNEKFIVIASDSIWQYIDSDECVEIIKDFYEKNMDAIGALNSLVTEAIKRWKKQDNKIEDITAVVIFFE